jgi:deazaflavin-dependent oxidoreductase (nitroreductase family)
MRTIAKTLMGVLGVAVAFQVVDTVLHLWGWRSHSPRVLRFVKRYNKHVINPLMLRFSGRFGHAAVVRHLGRRSGMPYATPVMAHRSQQDVIIPLPYGTDVDWLHNLQAAGQAMVDLEGDSLRVDEPAVVDVDSVVDLLPATMVRTIRFNGAREAVRLRILEPATAHS